MLQFPLLLALAMPSAHPEMPTISGVGWVDDIVLAIPIYTTEGFLYIWGDVAALQSLAALAMQLSIPFVLLDQYKDLAQYTLVSN